MPRPPAPPTGRSPRTAERVSVLGVVALGIAASWPLRDAASGPVLCPIRLVLGVECPGCGLTRSWIHAMHGDLSGALAANAFGLPLLVAIVVLAWISLRRRVRHEAPVDLDRVLRHPVTLTILGGWLLWGVVRIFAS